MREFSTLAFSLLGFALFYAAVPARSPVQMRASPVGFRLAGALVFALSLAPLWSQSVSLSWLMLTTAASVAATFFVLLTPVVPRMMWTLSALCAPLGAWLWWGAAHAG